MKPSHPRRVLTLAALLALGTVHAGQAPSHGAPAVAPPKEATPKEATPKDAVAKVAAPKGAAHAASAAAQAAMSATAASAPADPLARVQQRLAARFSAHTATDASATGPVVRVVSKSTPEPAQAATPADMTLRPRAQVAPRRTVPAATAPAGHAVEAHAGHWAYEGQAGPDAWGRLKPEFSACAVGKRQSPIDIREGVRLGLDPVQFDYQPASFKVLDNGHTIQVDVAPGNGIEVLGQRFELLQFHFHRPSEEAVDGKRFDMVAHFVHKNPAGRLAVVAVLLERGAAQAQLQQVWNHLPLEKGDTVAARGTIDLARLLPEQRGYFTYMGSLTTPPCSEGVLWMVMKQPVQVSPEQVGVFARLYPMNARPIQAASGRLIKESN